MIYVLAFVASFVFVFLKSYQQLNVFKGAYRWVMPTSMAMAACEVLVIVNVADVGWGWIIVPVGVGAGLGCMSSMKLHERIK